MGDPLICTPRPAAPRMWSRPSRSASRRAPFPSRARRRTTASRSDPRATQVPQHREGPARAPGGPPRGLGHVARVGALNRLRRPFCGAPLARESPRRAPKEVVRATLPTRGPSRRRWSDRRGRAQRCAPRRRAVTARGLGVRLKQSRARNIELNLLSCCRAARRAPAGERPGSLRALAGAWVGGSRGGVRGGGPGVAERVGSYLLWPLPRKGYQAPTAATCAAVDFVACSDRNCAS